MKGLTTPLLHWLRGLYLFVQVRGTRAWPPTGLIPWFSKTEGNTYATLLHHPFLFKGKPTQCSRGSTYRNAIQENEQLRRANESLKRKTEIHDILFKVMQITYTRFLV